MVNPEFFDDPIEITLTMDSQGQISLQNFTWQGQQYPVVAVGRQWDEDDGRHVMAEAADGARFELQLRRQDLIWYVSRVWRTEFIA
jgi:hypothetical protein